LIYFLFHMGSAYEKRTQRLPTNLLTVFEVGQINDIPDIL